MKKSRRRKESFLSYILNWKTTFALGLIVTSAVVYYIHYNIFKDLHHILIFLVEDIAFIPIEVLIVSLIIHRLLEARDKQKMLKKLNMVIGAFYSELGNDLITKFVSLDINCQDFRCKLQLDSSWSEDEFQEARNELLNYEHNIKIENIEELQAIKEFLSEEKSFLLDLLENPNLLEHDSFTDLLWAVFHLTEELMYRENIQKMSAKDIEHIEGDIQRAYVHLIEEWIFYMDHLEKDYPYLFSLAVRINPFNDKSNVEIK
ncbi:hypothetical protein [Selenihalanaerobacter shriftii]|uniref:Uncharacterized protein n=1 Tax=Selenihalanaerobacter shriftii TaxID=142842 RepID=A0A1T4LS99_9FIRM|nr:hypothetical protein [Selenihalanaerobacter shriftii]SJZ57602.1 hypothetical protein SAMN02745118_01231 [Selenihalanaerobacter shriftii]